jgi:hypothetical protein
MRQHLDLIGRDGEIRTRDPLNPIQVRYQAALRPDRAPRARASGDFTSDLAGVADCLSTSVEFRVEFRP